MAAREKGSDQFGQNLKPKVQKYISASSDGFHVGWFYTVGARFMMYELEAGDLWMVAQLPRITMDRFGADDL